MNYKLSCWGGERVDANTAQEKRRLTQHPRGASTSASRRTHHLPAQRSSSPTPRTCTTPPRSRPPKTTLLWPPRSPHLHLLLAAVACFLLQFAPQTRLLLLRLRSWASRRRRRTSRRSLPRWHTGSARIAPRAGFSPWLYTIHERMACCGSSTAVAARGEEDGPPE